MYRLSTKRKSETESMAWRVLNILFTSFRVAIYHILFQAWAMPDVGSKAIIAYNMILLQRTLINSYMRTLACIICYLFGR